MKTWLSALDRVLRGDSTRSAQPAESLAKLPVGGLLILITLLGLIYGMGMGSFAVFHERGPSWAQFFASAVKIPMLFLLTLLVTFPSLYVFNALVGSQLGLMSVLRLLIAALSIIVTVLASFGPIVAFFSISTTSYPFMVLLNVVMCAVAGVLGLVFLQRTLHRLTLALSAPALPPAPGATPSPLGSEAGARKSVLDPLGVAASREVRNVFRCWIVLFALVGSQMSWVLRPFIGRPDAPFTFFREREANFFSGLWNLFLSLFS